MVIMTDRDNNELMVLTSHEIKEFHLKNNKKKIPFAKHANGITSYEKYVPFLLKIENDIIYLVVESDYTKD